MIIVINIIINMIIIIIIVFRLNIWEVKELWVRIKIWLKPFIKGYDLKLSYNSNQKHHMLGFPING